MVYVEEYEAGSASVAFVLNFKTNNEGWDGDTDKTYTAKLLLTDGTVIEADTDDKNPSAFKNKFVSYTVDDDGIYTLKAKDVTSDAGDSIYLTKGTSKFDINGTNNKGGERYANSSTIFLVYDEEEKEYSVDTGIANVPSMDGKATVYVNSKDGKPGSVAKYVFISAASDVVSNSNKAQIYILAGSQSKLISDSEKGDYYTYDAVIDGKPLVERIVTVTGAVRQPANLRLRIGTITEDIIGECGGFSGDVGKVIFGGAMTGMCAPNTSIPIAKATGGILVLDKQDAASVEEGPCLRCGKCVEVCPIGLHPLKIKIAADADRIDECKRLHVMDCTLCGSCSFICPAHRWLTASFKVAKQKLAAQAKKGGSGK